MKEDIRSILITNNESEFILFIEELYFPGESVFRNISKDFLLLLLLFLLWRFFFLLWWDLYWLWGWHLDDEKRGHRCVKRGVEIWRLVIVGIIAHSCQAWWSDHVRLLFWNKDSRWFVKIRFCFRLSSHIKFVLQDWFERLLLIAFWICWPHSSLILFKFITPRRPIENSLRCKRNVQRFWRFTKTNLFSPRRTRLSIFPQHLNLFASK